MKTFKEFFQQQQEEVAANAMSAQAPSAIANPNNRKLFGGVETRFSKKRKKQIRLGVGE
jgi:hypothetical protein